VCAQDWMRLAGQPIPIEENIDEVENFEKDKFYNILKINCITLI